MGEGAYFYRLKLKTRLLPRLHRTNEMNEWNERMNERRVIRLSLKEIAFDSTGGMATPRGSDDTVNGRENGDSIAALLRFPGERQDEESNSIQGGGNYMAPAYNFSEGSWPWLLYVSTQHQPYVEPAGVRGRSRYA